MSSEDRGLVSRVGPIEIDWPRTSGYYAGIALAVGLGVIEPPLGIFIAAVPFLKMLNRPNSSLPARTVSQFLEGAAKPVGGDSASSIRLASSQTTKPLRADRLLPSIHPVAEVRSIWAEAQRMR